MSIIGIWIAAFLTLCIYSFLYKDNPLYRFAEHLFVGISVGYGIVLSIHQGFIPLAWKPFWAAITGESMGGLIKLIPIGIGLLFFARLSPRHTWVIRYPIAILIGFGAGIAIPNVLQANIFEQTRGTIEPFSQIYSGNLTLVGFIGAIFMGFGVICSLMYFLFPVERRNSFVGIPIIGVGFLIIGFGLAISNSIMDSNITPMEIFGAILMVVGVICTLTYFFFSVEHRGPVKWVSKVGIAFLMIGFGSAFGNTVMGRVALLIQRADFLINDWLVSIGTIFG